MAKQFLKSCALALTPSLGESPFFPAVSLCNGSGRVPLDGVTACSPHQKQGSLWLCLLLSLQQQKFRGTGPRVPRDALLEHQAMKAFPALRPHLNTNNVLSLLFSTPLCTGCPWREGS